MVSPRPVYRPISSAASRGVIPLSASNRVGCSVPATRQTLIGTGGSSGSTSISPAAVSCWCWGDGRVLGAGAGGGVVGFEWCGHWPAARQVVVFTPTYGPTAACCRGQRAGGGQPAPNQCPAGLGVAGRRAPNRPRPPPAGRIGSGSRVRPSGVSDSPAGPGASNRLDAGGGRRPEASERAPGQAGARLDAVAGWSTGWAAVGGWAATPAAEVKSTAAAKAVPRDEQGAGQSEARDRD
jgi:hypothetical protein